MGDIMGRVRQVQREPGTLSRRAFKKEGSLSKNTPGEMSRIARFRAPTVHAVRSGRENRFDVTLPAFESFTTDGTGGNSETFNFSHNLVESPNTVSVVAYNGANRIASSDLTIDYQNNTVDYTDPGTNNDLYIWYVTADAATLYIEKRAPSSSHSAHSEDLYESNLSLVHRTNLSEQPEFFNLKDGNRPLRPFLAADMTLDVYLDAPYQFRWEDPNGDGATPSNLLFGIPVQRGRQKVSGLFQAVKQDMGAR
jgi:hypothetical protein